MKTISTTLPSRDRLTALAILLVVCAIWGGTFFMIKDAVAHFPVMGFLTLRFTIATLVLLPFALRVGRWPTRTELVWGVSAGLLLTWGYLLQTFSMRFNDSSRTGFITSLYAVIVPFLAYFLLRQPLTIRILAGTILALAGLVLLGYSPGGTPFGDFLAVLSTFIWAFQIVAVSRFPRGTDLRMMTILQISSNGAFCALLLVVFPMFRDCPGAICEAMRPFADPLPTSIPLQVLGVALFTAIFASALGFTVQIWAQRRISASEAAIIYAMESPFSALFGTIFRGEILTSTGLFGGALIVGGVVITTLTSPDKPSSPDPILPGEPAIGRRLTRVFTRDSSTKEISP